MGIVNEVATFFKDALGFVDAKEGATLPKPAYWQNQILGAAKIEEAWRKKAFEYYRIFRAGETGVIFTTFLNTEHKASVQEAAANSNLKPRFNVFYANTETLKSILLPQMPRLALRRRFDDEELSEKQTAFYETVSDLVERVMNFYLDKFSLDEFVKFKYDYLVTGRSVLWLTYSATQDEQGNVSDVDINLEHINFDNFLMAPAQRWSEVWWIARRKFYGREELKKRFPDADLDRIGFKSRIEQTQFKSAQEAQVWEVWNKREKKVIFFTPDYDKLLGEIDDPYNLKNFFPTPMPLYSIYSPLNMSPTPEFEEYVNQASDLSAVSERITKIVKTISPRAFYRQSESEDLKSLLNAGDNEYVPVKNIAFEEGAPLFSFMPLKEKYEAVAALQGHEKNLINEIYELTGISEVMRNISTTETATLTNQRTRFGTARLQQRQNEINAYFKNLFTLAVELASEFLNEATCRRITNLNLFSAEELSAQQKSVGVRLEKNLNSQRDITAGIAALQNERERDSLQREIDNLKSEFEILRAAQQKLENTFTWDTILGYLKEKRLLDFLIDIETDFSLESNVYDQQTQRLQTFNTFVGSIRELMPLLQNAPSFTKILTSMFAFVMDSFKLTKSQRIELDETLKSLDVETKQEISAAPNPELIRAQAELMTAQARTKEAEIQALRAQAELEIERDKVGRNEKMKFLELQMQQQKNLHEQQMAEIKSQTERNLAEIKRQDTLIKARAENAKSQNDVEISDDKLAGHYVKKGILPTQEI